MPAEDYVVPLPPRPVEETPPPQPAVLAMLPTAESPGSEEKIQILAMRAELGVGLHMEGDAYDRTFPGAGRQNDVPATLKMHPKRQQRRRAAA